MTLSVKFVGRVLWRIAIEFAPLLAFAIAWIKYGPPAQSGPLTFSFLFFAASWFWGQFLRICYQQDQLQRFAGLGTELSAIKGTVETILRSIADLKDRGGKDIDPEIQRLSALANIANNQIDAANTAYEAARSFVLPADPGHYKFRSGSE